MRRTLTMMVLLLCFAASHAQEFTNDWGNYLKPSPGGNTGGLDVNVNEATGAVSYNVDLCTISQNNQSFGVGLNYYSTGVRIDDYASFVGLGWNLNAGGMITKMVRGLDDEDAAKGYRVNYNNPSPATINEVKTGNRDAEPDVYAFNMFGRSGKFVFHPTTGKYIPLNAEDILIKWVTSPSPHFEITDENGTVYHFTLQEQSNLKSGTNGTAIKVDLGTVVSGWFLTKIVLADHSLINISYVARTITELPTSTVETDIARYELGSTSMCSELNPNGSTLPKSYNRVEYFTTYTTQRISSISYKTGIVDFTYSASQRSDIPGDYALEYITIKDKQNVALKKYKLAYTSHSNRLLLQSVSSFEGSSTASLILNTFSYYTDHAMPAPGTTVSQDEYGYFNGAAAYTTLMFSTVVNTLLPALDNLTGTYRIDGANRGFGTTSQIQTLMLKSVKTLEGGTLTIGYEPNQFNGNDPYNAQIPSVQNRQGPGLRVALLTSNDNNKHNYYTRYSYVDNGLSTGIYINQYAFSNHLNGIFVISNKRNPGPDEATATDQCKGALRYSDRRAHVPMSLSSPIFYKLVKVMQFSNPTDEAGSSNGYVIKSFSYDPDLFNTTVHNVRDYMFGNLTAVTTYNKSGQAVGGEEYTYEYSHAGSFGAKSVYLQVLDINIDNKGTATGWDDQYSYVYHHNFISYNVYIGRRDLKEKKTHRRGTNAVLLAPLSEIYTYDTLHNLVLIEQHQNNVLKHTTELKRSYQYAPLTTGGDDMNKAINYMKNNHIHAPVIESITSTHTPTIQYITSAALQLYKLDQVRNVILPTTQFSLLQTSAVAATSYQKTGITSGTFTYDAKFEAVLGIDVTDDNDRPVQVNSHKDTVATFNNDEGQSYCTANKALFKEIAYCGFEDFEALQINGPKGEVGNFQFAISCGPISSDAFAGTGAFNLASCGSNIHTLKQLDPNRKYVFQCWKKGNVTVAKTGGNVTGNLIRTVGDWQLMQYEVTATTFIHINGTGMIDEIKLFPVGAAMSATSIDALGRTVAECDANNQYTRYEYDEYGRLRTIYDTDKNIIKQYEYAIQTPQ